MATDFNKPVVTDAYATLLPGLVTANKDLARMLEPTLTGTSTNIPTGAVRWNAATIRWERYNGTSWVTLPAAGDNIYAISISGNAATATSATTATHLAAGVAGAIPYQSAVGATAFTAAGTSGYILKSNGAGAPTWVAQSTLSVGSATTAGSANSASSVAWSGVAGKPTTVAGYGISDMASQTVASANALNADNGYTIGGLTVSAPGSEASIILAYSGQTVVSYLYKNSSTIFGCYSPTLGGIFSIDYSKNATFSGNVTAYSDARLKTNLEVIPDALAKVQQLTGYTYTRTDSGARQTGVIAQDLQKVLPEAVMDDGEYLSVAYGNIVGLLIEAVKELKSEIDSLKTGGG